jgi:phage shock protein B
MEQMAIAGIIIAPFIVFLVIVAPIWIIMHYIAVSRRDRLARSGTAVSADDQEMMARMIGLLEKMEGRITTLEKILDAESPRWRERQSQPDRM